jgi:hypothetical protein
LTGHDPRRERQVNTQVTVSVPVLRRGDESGTVGRLQEMLNVFVGHGEEHSHVVPLAVDARAMSP